MSALPVVGVVGAGTMGAGIAQVAALAGHRVLLFDAHAGAVAEAVAGIRRSLSQRIEKGRMDAKQANEAVARIEAVSELTALSSAVLVIEAIVESLDAKRTLFAELEGIVAPHCLLATNTSSLSVTAIARELSHAGRLVGMHFFNPVPAMKLVEIISGLDTEAAVARQVEDLARAWGKTPVHARNTPGFIVNRIARPFYGEAFQLIEQGWADRRQVDAALCGAGFRMGPCELSDLIGQDVNAAVTESVYRASFGDRRYLPSLLQRELVDGGRLGRKSGRGFYSYPREDETSLEGEVFAPLPAGALEVRVCGRHPLDDILRTGLREAGWPAECVTAEDFSLRMHTREGTQIRLHLSDGRPAARCAAESGETSVAVLDWPLGGHLPVALPVAFSPSCTESERELAKRALHTMGITPIIIDDAPGLCVCRTVAMLVNEAADAVGQRVCDAAAADAAMRLGTNWPAGPFDWLRAIGAAPIVTVLDHLFEAARSERYRASMGLRQRCWQDALSQRSVA